jgi:uncharacterized membrane protein
VRAQLERWLAVALGVLALLALATVFVVPSLGPRSDAPADSEAVASMETLRAEVIEILDEGSVDLGDGAVQPFQKLLLRVESGSLAGQEITIEVGTINVVSRDRLFRPRDTVYVERLAGQDRDVLYISDLDRTPRLVWVGLVFVAAILVLGRGKGLRSLLGMAFGIGVVFAFVLPMVVKGRDPVGVTIVGAVVLVGVSTYIVHGLRPKAHAAVIGMVASLTLTGLLAWLFVAWTRLSGFSVEESAYLVLELGDQVNLRGLLLAGIIIGSLGVLDDICIGQASAVYELAAANRELTWRQLYRRSLNIGRDHVAATVNTLFLAYVGASMPLMLAFMIYNEPLWRRLSREPIAEEVVRALVGSVGLLLAVPITSLAASLMVGWSRGKDQRSQLLHDR